MATAAVYSRPVPGNSVSRTPRRTFADVAPVAQRNDDDDDESPTDGTVPAAAAVAAANGELRIIVENEAGPLRVDVQLNNNYAGDPQDDRLRRLLARIIAGVVDKLHTQIYHGFSRLLVGDCLQKMVLTGFEKTPVSVELLDFVTNFRFEYYHQALCDFALMIESNWARSYISITFDTRPKEVNNIQDKFNFIPAVDGVELKHKAAIAELVEDVQEEDRPVFWALVATLRKSYGIRGVLRFEITHAQGGNYKLRVYDWEGSCQPAEWLSWETINAFFSWKPVSMDSMIFFPYKRQNCITIFVRSKNHNPGFDVDRVTSEERRQRTDNFMPANLVSSAPPTVVIQNI
jgi:hypothetical protein